MGYGELAAVCYGVAFTGITIFLIRQSRSTIARLREMLGAHANVAKYRKTMLLPRILATLQFTAVTGSALALLACGAKWALS